MNLLLCTQVVDRDDPILGFFHEWLVEFSKNCGHVHVVCLQEGVHDLPANVTVHSLGKERGVNRIARSLQALRLFAALRKEYDTVFVHMNPEYVILGGVLWRVWHKKIALWYTHKSVTLRLRLALLFAHHVFTASKESFRLRSRKVHIVGHGINTKLFTVAARSPGEMNIITVGRISPTKRLHDLLPALDLLYARGRSFSLTIIGAPIYAMDRAYEAHLQGEIAKRPYANAIHFVGPVHYRDLAVHLARASIFVNLSDTGSLDKAVLDGFAAGVPAVSTNVAFKEILEPHGLFVFHSSPLALVEAMEKAAQIPGTPFRGYVSSHHSLERLIPAMLKILS